MYSREGSDGYYEELSTTRNALYHSHQSPKLKKEDGLTSDRLHEFCNITRGDPSSFRLLQCGTGYVDGKRSGRIDEAAHRGPLRVPHRHALTNVEISI